MSNYREQLGNLPNQFGVARNAIPWSHQEVKVSGNGLTTVYFDSSKPNMFMLQNPNNTTIHIGLSRIPTDKNYEFKIDANTSATFGRPVPSDVLYILNKGNADAVVSLFSIYDKFDMAILQTLNVDLSKSPMFDGIINGFGNGVSLPSGSNKIGNVGLSGAIPTGDNKIGNVGLAGAIPEGTNNIGNVGLAGAIPEGSNLIGKVEEVYKPINMLYAGVESEAVTIDLSNRKINYIVFLSNDGESELIVSLKKSDGNSCPVRLKAGETLNDLPFEFSSMKLTGDNVSFRYLVGERVV